MGIISGRHYGQGHGLQHATGLYLSEDFLALFTPSSSSMMILTCAFSFTGRGDPRVQALAMQIPLNQTAQVTVIVDDKDGMKRAKCLHSK